jgi:hypothetical protein
MNAFAPLSGGLDLMDVPSTATAAAGTLQLAIVIPVHHEAGCIAKVVDQWMAVLDSLELESHSAPQIVADDKSTDILRERAPRAFGCS